MAVVNPYSTPPRNVYIHIQGGAIKNQAITLGKAAAAGKVKNVFIKTGKK